MGDKLNLNAHTAIEPWIPSEVSVRYGKIRYIKG